MIFKVFRSFLQLCIFALILQNGKSTHFRGGIISWKPISSSRLEIEFNFRLAFRRSSGSHHCDNNIIARRSIIGAGGAWRTRCLPSCGRQKAADTGFYCTSFSAQEDWSQGENYFNYTFPRAGIWEVSYSGCCWISTLVHGADGGWTLSTSVNLTTRSDTGTINSSPVSASSPIVRLQSVCPHTIKIPTEDADGDLVRCRWAVGSTECSGVCNAFPWGILDEDKCTIFYNGKGRRGWYAVAITLEDFPPTTTNFRKASGFSKVGLQFLVHIAQYSGVCNRKPFMTGSSPSDGACLEIPTNRVSRFTLEAKHMDSSKSVVEILTVSPLGLVMTPLRSYTDSFGDRVYYKNVSWTPSSNQVGQHIFCFKALDKTGFESQQRCVTFLVGSGNTPIPILSSRFPVSNPVVHWSRSVVWRISFNSLIKRPKHSKFIKLFLLGHEIYRLDTRTSRDVSIVGNSSTLQFVTPSVVLSMRGNYSLIIDPGAVVGQGCSSDGPATPGLTSFDDWTFFAGACAKGLYLGGRYHSCVDVDECATVSPLKVNARQRRSSLINKGTRERHRRWSEPAECTNYTRISSVDRAVGYDYYIAHNSRFFCDNNNLIDGWYRFTGNAGTQMLESCARVGKCGTYFPGWLNGTHPTVQEGLVNRTVCFGYSHWWFANRLCCSGNQTILVRNCSGFYVYRLTSTHTATPYCSRYCGNSRNVNGNINVGFSTPRPVTTRRIRSSAAITVLPSTVLLSDLFLSTVLPSAVLPSTVLPSAVLPSTVLPSTVLPSAVLPSTVLTSAVLPSVVLPSAVLSSAVLPSTVLPSAVLPSTVLPSTVLPSAMLPFAVLSSVVLTSAVLPSIVLPSAVLSSAVLPSTVLPSAVLPSAVLSSAVLPSVVLPSTVLPYRPTAGRYSSFVLRLPSNCNQLCVNTWGSFYCTCHPGYILSADGRTCVDEDECQNNNGGCSHKCNNVIGSHYCTCPEGQTMRSDNKSCNEPGINVVCSDRYLQISLEKRYFKGFDASRMHLEYKSCTPTTNSTHITFRTEFSDCGTRHNETEGKIRFMNTVKTDLLIIDGVVTRTQKVLLPFYCEYSKEKLMSVSFTTKTVVFASEGGYGNFSFKFNLYKTNLFVEPFRAADYPILVGLNQPIFLQYEIVSSNRSLVVFAENCRATPSANPYAVPQYVFLRRGCALDSTMSYNYILSPVQRFSINTFRFLLDHRAVFIHCELMACHSNTVISRCAQGCQRRRKRSDEPSFQNRESVSSRKYNLGFGPITLSKKEKAKAEKSSVTLAATVGTVGGALLIVIAILVVIILRKWVPNSLQSRSRETNISLNQRKEVSVLAFENQGNNIAENGI